MVNDDTVDHRVIPQPYPIITGETVLGNLVNQRISKESLHRLVSVDLEGM